MTIEKFALSEKLDKAYIKYKETKSESDLIVLNDLCITFAKGVIGNRFSHIAINEFDSIVNDSLMKAIQKNDMREGECAKWLAAVLTNKLKDHYRRAGAAKRSGAVSIDAIIRPEFSEGLSALLAEDNQDALDERIDSKTKPEMSADPELLKALSKISINSLVVLKMQIYDDLKYEQIAQLTHTPLGTVKSRRHTAIREIKKITEEFHKKYNLDSPEASRALLIAIDTVINKQATAHPDSYSHTEALANEPSSSPSIT